jgi:predicted acyl esterase
MIVIDKNVMVPMTDGVRLATDVFRLQEAPPSPVLLTLSNSALGPTYPGLRRLHPHDSRTMSSVSKSS